MAEGTDVVPDSVSNFGLKSRDASHELIGQTGAALGDISGAKPGASGLDEGMRFQARYRAELQRLQMFHQDAQTGLTALSMGAITIAQNYRDADMSQAQQMNTVDAAFNPTAGTPSMASQAAENRAAAEAHAAANPLEAKELPPAQVQPPVLGPPAPTPQQTVAAHNAKYASDWRPTPPKPKASSAPPSTGTTTTTLPTYGPPVPKPAANGGAPPGTGTTTTTAASSAPAAKPAVGQRMEKTETAAASPTQTTTPTAQP